MTARPVSLDCSDSVWQVTLERPAHGNACSAELVAALDGILQRAEDERPQAVVLSGAGRHFCTGFDLSDIASTHDDALLARFVRIELVLQRLARAPFLTVAVAQGRAIGAGADLFTACEVRLVREGATFAFPGGRGFGLVLGTRRLCDAVGRGPALAWIEGGASITSEEALRTGLATGALGIDECAKSAIRARLHADASLGCALRRAARPAGATEDAFDLQKLIESAARPGLCDRIAAYVERSSSRRTAEAGSDR